MFRSEAQFYLNPMCLDRLMGPCNFDQATPSLVNIRSGSIIKLLCTSLDINLAFIQNTPSKLSAPNSPMGAIRYSPMGILLDTKSDLGQPTKYVGDKSERRKSTTNLSNVKIIFQNIKKDLHREGPHCWIKLKVQEARKKRLRKIQKKRMLKRKENEWATFTNEVRDAIEKRKSVNLQGKKKKIHQLLSRSRRNRKPELKQWTQSRHASWVNSWGNIPPWVNAEYKKEILEFFFFFYQILSDNLIIHFA